MRKYSYKVRVNQLLRKILELRLHPFGQKNDNAEKSTLFCNKNNLPRFQVERFLVITKNRYLL